MQYQDQHYTIINQEKDRKIALLPLGAIEQHGPHLAVATDTDIVTRIAREAEQRMPEQVLLCPTLPYGSSHHHKAFGGTISIGPALYTQVITDLVGSLVENGFRRIVLLNGHGGNITPVRQALAVLSQRYDAGVPPVGGNAGSGDAGAGPNIALATYWELAGKTFAGAPPMDSPALSHACEYETSLMLHLYPEKVWMDRVERAARPASNGYVPWEDDEAYRGVTVFKATPYISSNGSSGEPQKGTAAKGQHLFGSAVEALVQFLGSFGSWPLMDSLKQ